MSDKKLIHVLLDDLIPYENNPRINDQAVDAVAASIEECGYVNPIIVNGDLVVLAGHTRLKALQAAGETEADVLQVTGMDEEQEAKYRLLDNKLNEKAGWNFEKLRQESTGLDFTYDFGISKLLDVGDNLAAGEKQESQDKEITPAAGSDKKICTCPRCGRRFED